MSSGEVLLTIVENVGPRFRQIAESDAKSKPDPQRWAKIEIVGHMIDSAINNHARFVVSELDNKLDFEGYKQEEWVALHDYLTCSWESTVAHWEAVNRHLARLIGQLSAEALSRMHENHSLGRMAWKTVPENVPTTLQYLIDDYIGHLEHHVRQVISDYQPVVVGTYEYRA